MRGRGGGSLRFFRSIIPCLPCRSDVFVVARQLAPTRGSLDLKKVHRVASCVVATAWSELFTGYNQFLNGWRMARSSCETPPRQRAKSSLSQAHLLRHLNLHLLLLLAHGLDGEVRHGLSNAGQHG